MNFNNLALDLSEIEKDYTENPLVYFKEKRLCLFKACLEKYFPGVRWGFQDLLEELHLESTTCQNQSCCSGTFFQRNLITRAQFSAINERNLSEMNQQADIAFFSCNGCYNSLLRGRDFLKNPEVRGKTQEILDSIGEETDSEKYSGIYKILENPKLRLVHELDFIYLIRNDVLNTLKFDLRNLKVAVHYGCHYLNLSRDKKTLNSYLGSKNKLEDLITLFGGIPVDYQERESCCGWGASQLLINPREALKITYNKLKSAENVGADFLLMPCPTCLYTLSKPEYRDNIEKWFGEKLEIPTIHLNELIAILRGCEEERCISLTRKTPRLEEIFEIITQL
ncbi:MAG: heterodisulfide reductase-related iron-sulfur binding cluster [Promethearchaeota archaeon]|jgi:heterodisulfide reductase subunit B